MAAWRSGKTGNSVGGCVNEIILHRARLVLGWVAVFGRYSTSVSYPADSQLSLLSLSGTENECQPKCSDEDGMA